jgi:hypothetical protein
MYFSLPDITKLMHIQQLTKVILPPNQSAVGKQALTMSTFLSKLSKALNMFRFWRDAVP